MEGGGGGGTRAKGKREAAQTKLPKVGLPEAMLGNGRSQDWVVAWQGLSFASLGLHVQYSESLQALWKTGSQQDPCGLPPSVASFPVS